MDEPTLKALLWSLATVVPVYIVICAVIGAKKKALSTWLLYGAAGSVVLLFPSVMILKGMFVESLTFSGQVPQATEWTQTWAEVPDGAVEIDYYQDPEKSYFSCKVDRDAFESWCDQNGLTRADRKKFARTYPMLLTRFKNRGVDLAERKLHYESAEVLAIYYPDASMMYVQLGYPELQ